MMPNYEQVCAWLEQATVGHLPDMRSAQLQALMQASPPLNVAAQVLLALPDQRAALKQLKHLLEEPVEPDDIFKKLLELGLVISMKLADEDANHDQVAFQEAIHVYQQRRALAESLRSLSDDVTHHYLQRTAYTRPFSADDEMPLQRVYLCRLKDAESARFERHHVQFVDLSERDQSYQEFMLELSTPALGLMRGVDAEQLQLRLIFDADYLSLDTRAGSLFDVELNQLEKRLYAKFLSHKTPDWLALESILILDSTP